MFNTLAPERSGSIARGIRQVRRGGPGLARTSLTKMHFHSLLQWPGSRSAELAPSLYDVLRDANSVPRSLPRAEVVSPEEIAGTTRHPSNTTADFLPIPAFRSKHWRDNWRRMLQAQERDVPMPPVQLIKLGQRYFVVDGHKRVAYARRVGAALDATVVELRPTPAAA